MIDAIGIDADDTLWHNEVIFEETHARYCELLSRYHDARTVERTLYATEMRNLELFGYGIKGYALSAIETAIALTNGEISAEEIRAILDSAKTMMRHPVELLTGVTETLAALADSGKADSAQNILPLGLTSRPGRFEGTDGDIALIILTRLADLGVFVTLIDQALLHFGVDSFDLTPATCDDNILKELFDRVARRAGDQGLGRGQHLIEELVTGFADNVAKFYLACLAADDDLDVDGLATGADIGVFLLHLADFDLRQSTARILLVNRGQDLRIDGVSSRWETDLIIGRREITLDQAQIRCARPDIDKERIVDRVDVTWLTDSSIIAHTQCRQEWLWNQQKTVKDTRNDMAKVFPRVFARVGRQSDHSPDFRRAARVDETPDMLSKVAGGLLIMNNSIAQGTVEIDMEPVLDRLFTEEDIGIARNDSVDDPFLHVPDDGRNDFAQLDIVGIGRTRYHA